ncbi:MAG: hypothetical protein JWR24_1944 [Actinoallomurus sp.]|jgi:hypothetical protein|nr:hypothetical protein [Actinoallomurus sp.]
MGIPTRMGVAISGLAFAGATALSLGAAAPASAQTATTTPHHAVTHWGGHKDYWKDSWETIDISESWWSWSCGCCC